MRKEERSERFEGKHLSWVQMHHFKEFNFIQPCFFPKLVFKSVLRLKNED